MNEQEQGSQRPGCGLLVFHYYFILIDRHDRSLYLSSMFIVSMIINIEHFYTCTYQTPIIDQSLQIFCRNLKCLQ